MSCYALAKFFCRNEGSTLHFVRALEHPRWEDFSYEPLEKMDRNRFYWLGNGATRADMDPAGNKAFYLDNIDVPPGKIHSLQNRCAVLTILDSTGVGLESSFS